MHGIIEIVQGKLGDSNENWNNKTKYYWFIKVIGMYPYQW